MTRGEDAVMVLLLIVVCLFALAVATLLLLELLAALPPTMAFIVAVSMAASVVMLGRAIRQRIAGWPSRLRGPVPILRHRRR